MNTSKEYTLKIIKVKRLVTSFENFKYLGKIHIPGHK
jgi:hypothetical protein